PPPAAISSSSASTLSNVRRKRNTEASPKRLKKKKGTRKATGGNRNVIVSINQRVVSGGDQLYPYHAYFKALMSSSDAQQLKLYPAGFLEPNSAAEEHTESHRESQWMEYAGPLFSDVFQCPVFLLSNLHLHIKLVPSDGAFAIRTPNANNAAYRMEISHSILHLRRVKVMPHISLAHEQGLTNQNALYPIERTEMQNFILPQGIQSKNIEGFTHGKLPKFIMLAFVSHRAFNGHHHASPLQFQSFNLSRLALKKGGETVCHGAFTPENNSFVREYLHYLKSCQSASHTNSVPWIPYQLFSNNTTVFAFDLTPEGAALWYGQKEGNLRLEIRFQQALNEAVSLIAMCLYDSLIEGSCMIVCGPTNAGKTTFVEHLIQYRDVMFDVKPGRVLWYYGISQAGHAELNSLEMVLIPKAEYEMLMQNLKPNETTTEADLKQAQKKCDDILYAEDCPEDVKTAMYQSAMQSLLAKRKHAGKEGARNTEAKLMKTETPQISTWEEKISKSVPQKFKTRARSLWTILSTNPELIRVCENGEVEIAGTSIPSSNILDLIQHTVRDSPCEREPVGWNEFIDFLQQKKLNVPLSAVEASSVRGTRAVKLAEADLVKKLTIEMSPPATALRVTNLVGGVDLRLDGGRGAQLPLRELALSMAHVIYRPVWPRVLIKRMRIPRVTLLLYPTGQLSICGAKTHADAKRAARRFVAMLHRRVPAQLLPHQTISFPSGPPAFACLNQQPFHSKGKMPVDAMNMYPGIAGKEQFSISVMTLAGVSSSTKFAGFVMKAVRASNGYTNTNLGPLLGSFACSTSAGMTVPPRYFSVYAPGGENNCVGHSTAGKDMYSSVTCTWTAPATNEGPIMFSATVVIEFEKYQTEIQSAIIPNSAGPASFSLGNDTLQSMPTMFGCGSTKTCALYPPSCDTRGGCRYGVLITPMPASNQLLFEIFGHTFDWLAVGLGDSDEMDKLEVFSCGYNSKRSKIRLDFGIVADKCVFPLYRPNRISCQFVRPVDATFSYYKYNMSSKSSSLISVTRKMSGEGKFVILGQGMNLANTPNIGKHTHLPLRSPVRLTPMGNKATVYFSGIEAKVQTHGTLMTTFWLFLCGLSIVVARHSRPVLTQKLVKKQLWFLIHVCAMVIGYVIALAGFIYILVKQGEWETDSQVHGIFGVIGMSLGLINIIAGIFRPHPGTKHRSIFNRLHRWNGLLAMAFATVAIWLGATFESLRPEFRFWAVIVLAIYTGMQIIAMILFECLRILYESVAATNSEPEPKIKGKQLEHVSEGWLVAYACVFLALAAAFWAGLWMH
uniref:ascorbate ferrireductase (transmembrane) n=1 Tax=Macrostomum lignano TaxID=282301 RepID=A0A1I8JIZ9_9PLAT